MAQATTDIHFREVRLAFPSKSGTPTLALDRVDGTLPAGKVTAIIGPSGCGKSTLLQLSRGFLAPSEGEVRYVDRRSSHSVAPPSMATVWQGFNLFPWRSVLDNVAFGLEVGGMARKEREDRARQALAKVELLSFAGKYPRQLSGGMRQRVGIARALVMEPEVLLLDEPFGALDAQTRLVLQEEVGRIVTETGATVMLITHSIEEAILLADVIWVMTARPGRIAREITVAMPRPRGLAELQSPAGTALFNEIHDLLRDEVLRAMRLESGLAA